MDDTRSANSGFDGSQKEDGVVRTRTRTRARGGADDRAESKSTTDTASSGADSGDGGGFTAGDDAAADERGDHPRRRRRGRRGRKRGSAGETHTPAAPGQTADVARAEPAETPPEAQQIAADEEVQAEARAATTSSPDRTSVEGQIARSGTRLTAKRQTRQRGRRRLGRARHTREQAPALAEDVRRAILQSVPRSMLVTTSKDRTQIAVLEDRTVAEHYVTRKEDVSYVGNIYMARVQNVLPGMEAAFLDIGKGRNGVLYAGEVLYDEIGRAHV